MNEFKRYHPVANFLYFAAVIGFSMVVLNPVCLIISFFASVCYSIILNGKKAAKFDFMFILPMIFVAALINPLFNHEGATIIGYFRNGNPLTLESVLYGFASSVMLACVICWFSCFNKIMTSDKFVYLFGKVTPSLSLVLSMVLRFVPRFNQHLKIIYNSQKSIGFDALEGNLFQKMKKCITIMSVMVTWALENSIETADSMRSRGYANSNRSFFSIFTFETKDKTAICCLIFLIIYIIAGLASKSVYFYYFPKTARIKISFYSLSVYISYFLLCFMPVIIEIKEQLKWKSIKSKI